MVSGIIPSVEFNEQLKRVVRQVLREELSQKDSVKNRRLRHMQWNWAIANADIDAASNGATSPSTGEVEIMKRDSVSGNLERTGVTHNGVNRWEGIEIEEGTLLVVARLDGEIAILAVDCIPMNEPPA